jgi:capsular polysaccharide biosynthesis protein
MDARHLVTAIRRNLAILILLPVLFAAGAGAVVDRMEPTYSAVSTVLLDPTAPADLADAAGTAQTGLDQAAVDSFIHTQLAIIEGRDVREAAAAALGDIDADSLDGSVTAEQRLDTMIVEVTANASNAEDSKRIADAVIAAYVADRRTANVSSLQRALDEVSRKAEEVRTAMAGTTISDAEFRTLERQFGELSSQAQDLEIALNLQQSSTQTVSNADVPDEPIAPQPLRTALTAFVLGGVVAVAVAGLRQRLDRTLRSPEDAAAVAQPILASLPRDRARKAPEALALVDDPLGPFAEGIRTLRTSLQFADVGGSRQVLAVTSGADGDGKSTIAANLAAAYAACGSRVLLVCANLRHTSETTRRHHQEPPYGLSDVIDAVHTASRQGEHLSQVVGSEARKAIVD